MLFWLIVLTIYLGLVVFSQAMKHSWSNGITVDSTVGRLNAGATSDAERNKRMRTTTIVGTPHPLLKPTCACRRCRTRRAKHTPRVVESTLVMARQSTTADWKQRPWWYFASAGLLLLVLLLTELGALWDIGPLAPLLFQPQSSSPLCRHAWTDRPHTHDHRSNRDT